MANIAFIHEKFPFGGAEVVSMNVIQSLEKYGYKFFIFTNFIDKTKIELFPKNVSIIESNYRFDKLDGTEFLISEIQQRSIDILVLKDNYIDLVKQTKATTNCKILYLHHSAPFWEKIYKEENGKHSASKSIIKWLEWYLLRSLKFKLGSFDKKLKKVYYKLYNSVDAFGVLCDSYGYEFANTLKIDYSSSKFVTLTNAAYPDVDYKTNKAKEICFVGRLSYADKRVDRLLKIWSLLENKYPDWILNIVGDGAESETLKRLSKDMNLKRVRFEGHTKEPQRYYDRAAIVCLTSTTEGWGLALVEAQTNGCVAIAFDCSAGVREILSPSWENGVLVKPFDIGEYANALSRLMSDDDLRNRIAENGRQHVAEFSEERTAQQWINMINKLLQ